MSQLYDCHTHIDNREDLVFYYEQGVTPWVNIASLAEYEQIKAWQTELEQVYGHLPIRYSVGVHPWRADQLDVDFADRYEELVAQAAAIGEIGLDSIWSDLSLDLQEQCFRYSLDLAAAVNKPVILHTKGQEGQVAAILQDYAVRVIVHWYSSLDHVADYLDLGAYFTIGPAVLTDPVVQELVSVLPLDRILLESDGRSALEWLLARPVSDSDWASLMNQTLEKIAELTNTSVATIKNQLSQNTQILYSISC